MPSLLELIQKKVETNERTLYLHILARCFLFRARSWKSPYGYYWFLDGYRISENLIEQFNIKQANSKVCAEGERQKIVYRPDVFFSRLWELKPKRIFHCLPDEDYAEQISSWGKLLRKVEMCTKEEQDFILQQIIKHGND